MKKILFLSICLLLFSGCQAEYNLNIGNYLYSTNNVSDAILNWTIASTIMPENSTVNLNLAQAYDKKGKLYPLPEDMTDGDLSEMIKKSIVENHDCLFEFLQKTSKEVEILSDILY